jgi:LacI family transcriptional regulator
MTARLVRVGLAIGHSLAFYRDILRGVKTFATERPEWVFTPMAPERAAIDHARPLRCDGYIAHIFSPTLAESLRRTRRPVINVSGVLPELPFHRVVADHREVGRMAARHLVERGLKQLAFFGYPNYEFSVDRETGFAEVARESGIPVSSFLERTRRVEDPTGLWKWNKSLQDWLGDLDKPVGILASHDTQAAQVAEYCRQLGFRVPDDVAIVGVDDDDLLCELARPSLSSVALPGERIGYEAARVLDQLLRGEAPAERALVLRPPGVVVRQSSNLMSVGDAEVAAAVRFIHDHAHEPLKVADVLKAVPVARRLLERRFRKWLQRSILDEIRRVHVERAKTLLAGTELSMSQIARQAGFYDSRHLSLLFRASTGMTPTSYRSGFRSGP